MGVKALKQAQHVTKSNALHSGTVQGLSGIRGCMKRIVIALALSAMPLATLPAATAQGGWGNSFTADDARDARERGEIKPLSQILRPIQNQYGGNMRHFVGLFDQGGRKVYIIDWVTRRGELVQFTIDAKTGRVIKVG